MTGKNQDRGRGTVVQSFSLPLRKANLIEEVSEQAAKEGLNFSKLVVKLLEDYNQEKNREARINHSAIQMKQPETCNTITSTQVNESLDRFIEQAESISDLGELAAIEGKGLTLVQKYRAQYKRVRWGF